MSKLKELLKSLFPEKTAEIDKVELDEQGLTIPKNNSSIDPAIEELKQLVKTQQAEITKLVNELTQVKDKELQNHKLLEDKAKKERTDSIDAIIKKAIEEMKIPAKNDQLIAQYKNILDKDLDAGKIVIENLQSAGKNPGSGESNQSQNNNSGNNSGMKSSLGRGDKPFLKAILERNEITA